MRFSPIRQRRDGANRVRAAMLALPLALLGLAPAVGGDAPADSALQRTHGIAMHGAPALPADFDHFPYADPAAKKGGRLRVGLPGTFDSLNPFNLKSGSAAQGLVNNVFQPLMARSQDEPFTLYPLVAQSIDVDPARTRIVFHLDPRARFSDGKPLTADDVLFSFDLLKTKGRPQQRIAYNLVRAIDAPDPHTVRIDITGVGDRELPLILAIMPVLPKHATEITGEKTCRASADFSISMKSTFSITATATPSLRPSRRDCSIIATRPAPRAGRRVTIFRRRATAAFCAKR
jgi:peptide/nickel transport system substrate-binding protein